MFNKIEHSIHKNANSIAMINDMEVSFVNKDVEDLNFDKP